MRQAIIYPPIADAGEAVSSDTATKGGGRGDTEENLSLHVFAGEPGDRLGVAGIGKHEPEEAGGPEGEFAMERVAHNTREIFVSL